MTKRIRSLSTVMSLCAAEKLWRAFCQAARIVSATVDFGPDGSLDRAWAVLETFAGWAPEVASGWELDEIADALSEVPELRAEFVEKDSIISVFLDETQHVYGRNRLIQQPIVPRRESDLELCEQALARYARRDQEDT